MLQQHIVYSDFTCNQRCPTLPAEALDIFVVFGEVLWGRRGARIHLKALFFVFFHVCVTDWFRSLSCGYTQLHKTRSLRGNLSGSKLHHGQ